MQITKTILAALVTMLGFTGVAQAALPTCSNVACPTMCGYAGGMVTSGAYDIIGHSPWIVCKTKACAATAPCPVNCVEHLSECSTTCGGGIQSPVIDTPAANGGTVCVLTEVTCNVEACPVIPAEVDCPITCGNATSTVADGLGGLKECAATDICVIEPATTTPEVVKPAAPARSQVGGERRMWEINPQGWILQQIAFVEAKIARLQAQLNALLGK